MTRNLQKIIKFYKSIIHYILIKTYIRQIIINLFDPVCDFHYIILMYNSLWEVPPIYSGYILHHSRDIINNIIKKIKLIFKIMVLIRNCLIWIVILILQWKAEQKLF